MDAGRVAESQGELEAVIGKDETAKTTEDVTPQDFVPVPISFEPVPVDFGFDDAFAAPLEPLVVTFRPHEAMYERGDDARNILIGLADAAKAVQDEEISVTCDMSALPPFDELVPDKPYLSWRVVLPSDVSDDSVNAVFDWVSDVCDFTLSRGDDPQPGGDESGTGDDAGAEPEKMLEAPSPAPSPEASVVAAASLPTPEAAPAVPAAPAAPAAGASARSVRRPEQASIRVDLHRIDDLMDLVGELVIAQAAIESLCRRNDTAAQREMVESVTSMKALTRDIQDAVMAVRAQPVRSVFQRMQRVVREACSMTHKDITLTLEGEDTEVDRTLVEKLTDPLTHMLRNAVDHGIESPEERLAAGKPAEGHILLSAGHRSGRILITIKDDGGGINRERVLATAIKRGIVAPDAVLTDDEVNNLIFAPGFSTAATVSDLSGRGVGMDVVKQAILGLGGRVTINSVQGEGTTFCLSLPLTLAVLDGMLIVAADSTMVIPISSVVETMMINPADIYSLPDGSRMVSIRGNCMPLVPLGSRLGLSTSEEPSEDAVILIVENESGMRVALVVDKICDQAQVVIKSIEKNYRQIPGVSAATILGDGSVSLILDVPALIASAIRNIDTRPANARSGLAA
ncbi:chemotaxis protein CheA [Komagataeibacter kakiaceti]|uniref:chemotaxis protein CheA n=1 Tax=Komagataeibacter kakiaceti TaxID=943261 RepID=UPI000B266A5D|nr:chemotaxis protein CheA [Komagataeibacter kakiaceti]